MKQKELKQILRYEDGKFYWKIPGKGRQMNKEAGCIGIKFKRRAITINHKKYLTYHLVWLYFNGYLPKQIDHIDRDCTNNRIENLRESNQTENMCNRKKQTNNISGFTGVVMINPNKWIASISHYGKRYHLGTFVTKEEAAHAYDKKAKELHGEFASLNFPV